MNVVPLQPDNMATAIKIIIENSNDDIFVFPTDVVMNSWTDWIITHTSKLAIELDRFIAWDNFKSQFVSAHLPGKSVIPSVLRKMFITDLITRNETEKKFNVIINPDYAKEANFNSDWLCDTLRSLHFWKKRYEELLEKNPQALAGANEYDKLEDEDLNTLYNEYKDFLDKRDLFEPSWVEITEFKEEVKNFHIFYPELLEDFSDYTELFESLENINVYMMPEQKEQAEMDNHNCIPDNFLVADKFEHPCGNLASKNDLTSSIPYAYLYPDARKELRQTMLSIINIVQSSKKSGNKELEVDWSEIALSVPDIEIYRPYIEREFNLYGIPYVIKAGVSLTKNSAGRIFREIQDCKKTNFSYDSIRTLLLDEYMPWKKDVNEKKEGLIREGSRMRCICSAADEDWKSKFKNLDIWEVSFDKKIAQIKNRIDKLSRCKNLTEEKADNLNKLMEDLEYFSNIKEFYKAFNCGISNFFNDNPDNDNFENILTSWMDFKKEFFDEENFTEDENNILSRCIVELKSIIDIEKEYPGLKLPSPYDFFLQELDKKTYTSQTCKTGVNIFPYKLSAAAYFKYQFVIDCSQRSVDVSYKRLSFLSDKKRDALLTEKEKLNNASNVFIQLYAKKTEVTDKKTVHFSAATDSFSGFAIPHSAVKVAEIIVPEDSEKTVADGVEANEAENCGETEDNENIKKKYKKINYFPNNDKDDYILQEKAIIKSPDDFLGKTNGDGDENSGHGKVRLLKSQIDSYNNWKASAISPEENYVLKDQMSNSVKKVLKMQDGSKPEISARGTLDNFFPCPRKWMLKNVLKVKEDSLDTNLMKVYDMGSLNHRILELFMQNFLCKDKMAEAPIEQNKVSNENLSKNHLETLPYFDEKEEKFKIKNNSTNNLYSRSISDTTADKDFEVEINKILNEVFDEAIDKSKIEDFEDSPLAIEAMKSQKKKTIAKIKEFLKILLLPYANSTPASAEAKDINGIGNCKVVGVEQTLYYKTEQDNKFNYNGQIDCYFKSPNNELIIVDYKNSKVPDAKDLDINSDGILGNFQMPMYYKLVSKKHTEDINACYFYPIQQKDYSKKIGFTDKVIAEASDNESALDEENNRISNILSVLDDYSNLFVKTLEGKDFTPVCYEKDENKKDISEKELKWENDKIKQNVQAHENCKDCAYKNICRTTYTIAGKNIKKIEK